MCTMIDNDDAITSTYGIPKPNYVRKDRPRPHSQCIRYKKKKRKTDSKLQCIVIRKAVRSNEIDKINEARVAKSKKQGGNEANEEKDTAYDSAL